MSKRGFIRDVFVTTPTCTEQTIQLPELGELNRPPVTRPPTWVWVVVFIIALVTLLVLLWRSGARQLGMGSLFIMPMMAVSVLMMLRNRGGAGSNEKTRPAAIAQTRVDYLRKIDEQRKQVHESAEAQAREIAYHHPSPSRGALLTLVSTPRMWERMPGAPNFGHVRLGVGMTKLRALISPPQNIPPPEYRETVTAIAARDFLLTQNVVHDVARPMHVFDQMGWAFFGEDNQRGMIQGMLRALVCQLCVFHPPDAVRLAIITDDLASWQWAKWLPHVADPDLVDASGPGRMIFTDVADFMERFDHELRQMPPWAPLLKGTEPPAEWFVVVVDLPGANCAPILGVGGHSGLSVLEATGDPDSLLATATTAYVLDDVGNLLKAATEVS